MNDLVRETLEGAQKALRKEKAAGNAAMIDDAVAKMSDKERAKVGADAGTCHRNAMYTVTM